MEKVGVWDGFRKLGVSDFKIIVYSYDVQFILFLFILCLSQYAKPIMDITNPNGLQKHAKSLKVWVCEPSIL